MPQMLVRYRLPVSYSTEIGRLMTRYAFLEWRLRELVYDLLEVSPKEGRIAVGGTRATDYLAKALDLIELKKLHVTPDLKKLRTPLRNLQSYRGAIAHGVSLRDPNSDVPTLQWLKGEYEASETGEKKKARFDPASRPLKLTELRRMVTAIAKNVVMVERAREEILAQLGSSRGKC